MSEIKIEPTVLYLPPETLDGHTAIYHPYNDIICAAGRVERDAAITWLIPQYEHGSKEDEIPPLPEFAQTNCLIQRPATHPQYLPGQSELILPLTSISCVRFSPDGRFLAVIGSDQERDRLFIFQLRLPKFYSELQKGVLKSFLRPELKFMMLSECAWSPDSSFLAVGTQEGQLLIINVRSHIASQFFDSDKPRMCNADLSIKVCRGPVMGLSWAPDGYLLACQSFQELQVIVKRICKQKITFQKSAHKFDQFLQKGSEKLILGQQSVRTFYAIALYRRYCAFSPDGSFLVSTAGLHRYQCDQLKSHSFCSWVFSKTDLCLGAAPSITLPGLRAPSVAVAFSPLLYELDVKKENVSDLPYRMLFAVAAGCDLVLYDTQKFEPLAIFEGESFQLDYITQVSFSATGSQILAFGAHFQYQFFDLGVFGEFQAQNQITAKAQNDKIAVDNENMNEKQEDNEENNKLQPYNLKITDLAEHKMVFKASVARMKGEFAAKTLRHQKGELKTKPAKPSQTTVEKVSFDRPVKCYSVCEMFQYDLQPPIALQIEKEELDFLVKQLDDAQTKQETTDKQQNMTEQIVKEENQLLIADKKE